MEDSALRRLESANWKGNVRELENALERALILSDGPNLLASDFDVDADDSNDQNEGGDDLRLAVERFERRHIQRVLSRCGGDKKEAARRLGLGLSSLYRKLEDSPPDQRST